MNSSRGRGRGRGGRLGGRSSGNRVNRGGARDGDQQQQQQKRYHRTQRGPLPSHKRRESGEGSNNEKSVRLNEGSMRTVNEAETRAEVKDG